MNRSASTVTCLLLILLVSACKTGPQIKSDYDQTVDFSDYRTYGFSPRLSIEESDYSTIHGAVAKMFEGCPATAGG